MNPFLKKCYMFTDNYYNSVALTEFLLQKSTYATSTLRKDRKRNPKEVTAGKPKKVRWFGSWYYRLEMERQAWCSSDFDCTHITNCYHFESP